MNDNPVEPEPARPEAAVPTPAERLPRTDLFQYLAYGLVGSFLAVQLALLVWLDFVN